jgi:hypothetical protein
VKRNYWGIEKLMRLMSLAVLAASSGTGAEEGAEAFRASLQNIAHAELLPIARDADVVAAVKAQNERNDVAEEEVAGKMSVLDAQWVEEANLGEGELFDKAYKNSLAEKLKKVQKDSSGLYNEIFVMDALGALVATSAITSDYWQGDEDKWQKTYLQGPETIFIDKIKYDESTKHLQAQISLTIEDPVSHQPIGAITFGVDKTVLDNPGATR